MPAGDHPEHRHHDVELPSLVRQILGVAMVERDVETLAISPFRRRFEQRRNQIEAGDVCPATRRGNCEVARTTGDIEHLVAREQPQPINELDGFVTEPSRDAVVIPRAPHAPRALGQRVVGDVQRARMSE